METLPHPLGGKKKRQKERGRKDGVGKEK